MGLIELPIIFVTHDPLLRSPIIHLRNTTFAPEITNCGKLGSSKTLVLGEEDLKLMDLLHLTQHSLTWLGDITLWTQGSLADGGQHGLLWDLSWDWSVLAQNLDTDVFRPVRVFFDNVIKSGQAWALLIGIILGYLLRSLTSYV